MRFPVLEIISIFVNHFHFLKSSIFWIFEVRIVSNPFHFIFYIILVHDIVAKFIYYFIFIYNSFIFLYYFNSWIREISIHDTWNINSWFLEISIHENFWIILYFCQVDSFIHCFCFKLIFNHIKFYRQSLFLYFYKKYKICIWHCI